MLMSGWIMKGLGIPILFPYCFNTPNYTILTSSKGGTRATTSSTGNGPGKLSIFKPNLV